MQNHTYLNFHKLSGRAFLVNLRERGQGILEEARLASVGHAAETLAKEDTLRITIIGFTAGSSMAEHKAEGPLSIGVLEGQIMVSTADETIPVMEGEVLVIAARVYHSVVAKTDSVVLLTIALHHAERHQ